MTVRSPSLTGIRGFDDLRIYSPLWTYTHPANTRPGLHLWSVDDSICNLVNV